MIGGGLEGVLIKHPRGKIDSGHIQKMSTQGAIAKLIAKLSSKTF